MNREGGKLLGMVQCGEGRGAVDVMVVWVMTNRASVVGQAAQLEPPRPDTPPGTDPAPTVDLGLPETANVADEIRVVWIEYWDDSRVGRWRDTWEVATDSPNEDLFRQTDSELVD